MSTSDAGATGATAFVAALRRLGVRTVFGLPGVHNLAIWKAIAASELELVGVRHEQAAVYAADGYARATGRLGVAVVTTGPGAANTLGAAGEAMASGSPVLVAATDIAAAIRRPGVYRGALHETRDQAAMFAPVTKATRTPSCAGEIAAAVLACGRLAASSPSGPVYLGIPTDLLSHPADPADLPDQAAAGPPPVDQGLLSRAAAVLGSARQPLIWAGGGALRAGAGPAVAALAERLDAPVVTTYMARGLIPPDHPCAVTGPAQTPEVGALWDAADVVLAVGTDFDGTMTQNWAMPRPPALIAVNIDHADANKNYRCDLTLAGDARQVTEALLAAVPPRQPRPGARDRVRQVNQQVAASVRDEEPAAGQFLDVLERVLPDDAVVVVDMCIPGYWLGGYRRVAQPRKLAYPVGWGTLGFGFPASIGAAFARSGRTVCVTGDGGFLFACGELATVAQHQLALSIVVVDDGGYGMLRYDQQQAGDAPFGVDLLTPDFTALAHAFGIPAQAVDGFGDAFERELTAALAADGPRMVVVKARLKPPVTTSPRWYRHRTG